MSDIDVGRVMMKRAYVALVLVLCVGLSSCAALGIPEFGGIGGRPNSPIVKVSGVTMSAMPTSKALASYYCGQYLGPLICRAFGPVTKIEDINFNFDVGLAFQNPNPIPLPLVSALFGFKAFPEATGEQNLGAVCLTMCEDPSNCQQSADACTSSEPEIRDINDFVGAAAGFLMSTALGQNKLSDLKVRTIPANENMNMVVRLGLSPVQTVKLIKKLAKGEINEVKRAKVPKFALPYELEGSAWVNVESFGRLASGFGPVQGKFDLL